MLPVPFDRANVTLTLPGGTSANDLPAERIDIYPPDADPADPDVQPTPGFDTLWMPEEDERERLLAGAPVALRVWGGLHPPVALTVTDVPPDRVGLTAEHAARAAGVLYAALADLGRMDTIHPLVEPEGPDPDEIEAMSPSAFLQLWEMAVRETAQASSRAEQLIAELRDQADQEQTLEQKLDAERAKRLQAHDGDKIAAAADYARDAADVVGRRDALVAATTVFGLDDTETAAVRDLITPDRELTKEQADALEQTCRCRLAEPDENGHSELIHNDRCPVHGAAR